MQQQGGEITAANIARKITAANIDGVDNMLLFSVAAEEGDRTGLKCPELENIS
jgi:hypothetical protein